MRAAQVVHRYLADRIIALDVPGMISGDNAAEMGMSLQPQLATSPLLGASLARESKERKSSEGNDTVRANEADEFMNLPYILL